MSMDTCLSKFDIHEGTLSPNCFKPLSANPTKWPNTLKQFVGNLLKGLKGLRAATQTLELLTFLKKSSNVRCLV